LLFFGHRTDAPPIARYCTRKPGFVSGAGEQELHTNFEEAYRYLETHTEVRRRPCFPEEMH